MKSTETATKVVGRNVSMSPTKNSTDDSGLSGQLVYLVTMRGVTMILFFAFDIYKPDSLLSQIFFVRNMHTHTQGYTSVSV